jgi:hypothetical protein
VKGCIKALSLSLLTALLVLTGCTNLLEPQQPVPDPKGTYVKVRFEPPHNDSARTIYPELPALTKYELTFSGPEAREPIARSSGGSHLIALAAGNWTITVTAFAGTEGAYIAIARGSAAVTVTIGQTAEATIALAPVSGEAGTFSYNITIPTGSTGNLVVTKAEGGVVSSGTISLQSGTPVSGHLNLPTGQYLMNISLILGDRRAGRTEALHIYPYRESAVEYYFFEHNFRLVSDLAYNQWTEADLEPGEAHWYKFAADGETSYRVQWNGASPQGDGTKGLPVMARAYTGDNTFIFENKTTGWVSPEAVSGIDGTVYILVQGANNADRGSYALRYYNPAELPPQEGINLRADPLPVPKIIVSWTETPGASGYRLYRTTDPAGGYHQIGGDFHANLYGDAAVLRGVTYYYRVSAYNDLGEGEKSPAVSAAPPAAETLSENDWTAGTLGAGETRWHTFTADAGKTYLVRWNGAPPQGEGTKTLPTSVSAYTEDGSLVFANKTEGWTAPETLSGLSGIVCLKVEGTNGAAGTFAIQYYDPTTVPPKSPVAAPVLSTGNGELTASWDTVPWATTYEVWTNTSNNTATATKYGADVLVLSAVISGLNNGTSYYVWIKAKNAGGTSGLSPVANGKPLGNMGVVTLTTADGQLRANWAAVAGADQYAVYYGTTTAMPETPARTLTATTATITGLVNGTTYYVWVTAKNDNGTSGPSPVVNGKPIGNIGAISLVATDGQLVASWAVVAGADRYEVYYSTTATMPGTPAQTLAATTVTLTERFGGTPYNVWVKPVNTWGIGGTNTPIRVVPATGIALNKSTAIIDGTETLTATISPSNASNKWVTWSSDNPEIATVSGGTVTALAVGTTVIRATAADGGFTAACTVTVPLRAHLYVGSAVDPEPGVFALSNAFTWLDANVASNTAYTIVLYQNLTMPARTLAYPGKTNVDITIKGDTGGRSIRLSGTGSLFTINSGVRLIVETLALRGRSNNSTVGNTGALVSVNGGSMEMRQDSLVTGNYSTGRGSSGGVQVISYGTFTMKDNASVSGNTSASNTVGGGGGVLVGYAGVFTMQDNATVNGNTASSSCGGGVYVGGTFTMKDNTSVKDNNTSFDGGGVYADGNFLMQGNASVSNNISSSNGGGVFVGGSGHFFMQDDASVSNNTSSSNGGGLFVGNNFKMRNNAMVSGNIAASNGGGVYIFGGAFAIQDNASVSDNTAAGGGGVYIDSYVNGTFIKKGGTIYGDTDTTHAAGSNENTATSGDGHAVYLYNSSKKRNSTAGTAINLFARYISGGAWTYNDTSTGGVGDTTANWE